jgi:hypothetical protein
MACIALPLLLLNVTNPACARPSSAIYQYIEMLHAWRHDGVASWGGGWESRAQGEAMEQLTGKIAQMANVESLVMSSSSSESDNIKVNAAIDMIKKSGSGA